MSTARIVFAAAAISIASIVGIDLIDVLQNVYYQSPPITKYWLGATALVSLFASIGVLSGETLDLNGNLFFNGLEFWRPFTAFLYYPIDIITSLDFIFNCYCIANFSTHLENGIYKDAPEKYVFLILFCWLSCLLVSSSWTLPDWVSPLVLSVTFTCCQLNPNDPIPFISVCHINLIYFPWILLAVNFVIFHEYKAEIVGIFISFVYTLLRQGYPEMVATYQNAAKSSLKHFSSQI